MLHIKFIIILLKHHIQTWQHLSHTGLESASSAQIQILVLKIFVAHGYTHIKVFYLVKTNIENTLFDFSLVLLEKRERPMIMLLNWV